MDKHIKKLLEAVKCVVEDGKGDWRERRDAVVAYAEDNDYGAALQEFTSWFFVQAEEVQ